jgi:hypothetical protein
VFLTYTKLLAEPGQGQIYDSTTNKTRKYNIYTSVSLHSIPMNAEIGDLAIVYDGNTTSGYYYNQSCQWIKDTGTRAGEQSGERLVHFPEKTWNSWVLSGPPGALRWERSGTVRQRLRRARQKNMRISPTPTVVEPDSKTGWIGKLVQESRFVDNIMLNRMMTFLTHFRSPVDDCSTRSGTISFDKSLSMSPNSLESPSILPDSCIDFGEPPSSDLPPVNPSLVSSAKVLVTEILDKLHLTFSKSPEALEKCCLPLNQLLEYIKATDVRVVDPRNAVDDGLLSARQFTLKGILEDLERTRFDGHKRKRHSDLKIHDSFKLVDNLGVEDLRVSLITSGMGPDNGDKRIPFILAALNIPPHPEGSGKVLVTIPHYINNSGSCSHVPGGYPDQTAVVSTIGFITEPHWDYYGVPQIVSHASGWKLWFVWPPTDHNIRVASDYLLVGATSIELTIGRALVLLNDLELRFCKKQNDYFTLPPFAVHAVISASACSHKNKLYTEFGYFDLWDRNFSFLFEKLIQTYNKGGTNGLTAECVIFELTEGCKAFHHWDALVRQIPTHPESPKVRARLDEMKRVMQEHLTKFQSLDCIATTRPGKKLRAQN